MGNHNSARDGEGSQSPSENADGESYGGFAQAISALEKLNRLESDIATILSSCKVPVKETRKFLRCNTPEQVANISLFQYMKALFMQLGVDIGISQIEPYFYRFQVYNSAISDLYSGTSGRTCDIISEAISRFFNRDLNLGCRVEETNCVNAGNETCEFEIAVDREDYCRMILSDEEKNILRELGSDEGAERLEVSSGIPPKEMEFRLSTFRRLELVGEDGRTTELGVKCSSQHTTEDDVDTPWEDMGELSSAISSAVSFAEASHLSIPPDSEDASYEGKGPDRKSVKGYKSFAELLAKQVDEESESEGF
jgi:predicted hydrocarbon binding protein